MRGGYGVLDVGEFGIKSIMLGPDGEPLFWSCTGYHHPCPSFGPCESKMLGPDDEPGP